MILLQLSGGLGNQMFQYALGRRLAIKQNLTLKLDTRFYRLTDQRHYALDRFCIEGEIATEADIKHVVGATKKQAIWRSIKNRHVPQKFRNVLKEYKEFVFDKAVIENKQNPKYLQGYWQNENYFKPISDTLREDFQWKSDMKPCLIDVYSTIKETTSVSLHIRRGDYVKNPRVVKKHGTVSLNYYEDAADRLVKELGSVRFYIFSDDIPWAKENLNLDYETVYIDQEGRTEHDDLRLMSACKHHIIANSSFSWWGAWLSDYPEKIVYAPSRWMNRSDIDTSDVTPPQWRRI